MNVFAPPIVCVVDVSTNPLAIALVDIDPLGKLTVPELTVTPLPITRFPVIFVFPHTSITYPESTLDLFTAIFANEPADPLPPPPPPPIAVQ